ncbi:MAG: hypothetical protein PHU34_06385 [Candidatus Methanoperedens sp.]|nr:hypothetical protein [Candidatus Methanoperedens sp.]
MNLKTVCLLAAVIGLAISVSGCTGGQDVTPVFKALPEVQQFMKEHPNAKITVTYWSKEEVAQSSQEISQQCDKPITPVAMYKATVSEGDLKIVSWINAENQIVICSVTEGQKTTTTVTTTPITTITPTPIVTPVIATQTPIPTATGTAVVTGTASPTVAAPGKFRVGPSVTLRPVIDVIDTNQDGIVELFMNNPSLNDVTLNVDARVGVPSGIHVYGESFGQAAGAGVVAGTFSVPPGTARTITIVIKADKSARIGSHTLQFTGLYWPSDDKNNFQPMSLTYYVTVKEPSKNPESAEPSTPTPTITPTPPPATPIATGTAKATGTGTAIATATVTAVVTPGVTPGITPLTYKTLGEREVWDLGNGYSLKASSICVKCIPKQAGIELLRNGNYLDSWIINEGDFNIKELTRDAIRFKVNSIFSSASSNMVQITDFTVG